MKQGEKLELLATKQNESFNTMTDVLSNFQHTQAIKQQGTNTRFESIMNVLQSIQTPQQSPIKLTQSPTTDTDQRSPDHKKPASSCEPPLSQASIDDFLLQTQPRQYLDPPVPPSAPPPDRK